MSNKPKPDAFEIRLKNRRVIGTKWNDDRYGFLFKRLDDNGKLKELKLSFTKEAVYSMMVIINKLDDNKNER